MADTQLDGFTRLPNQLLTGLLLARFSAIQFQIILWVLRKTTGWNRPLTSFSWYAIGDDLGLGRSGVFKAGRKLLAAGVLYLENGCLGIQADPGLWRREPLQCDGCHQAFPAGNGDDRQLKAMTPGNADVSPRQRNRFREETLFRRAKDSSKDILKTNKDKRARRSDHVGKPFQNGAFSKRRHPAGAARPIPGKYDGLSQN